MWIWIIAVSVFAAAILIVRYHFIARAARKASAKLMELRLEGLKFVIQDWKGSAYQLAPYDTDQHPEHAHFWRTLRIEPNATTTWHFNIDRQKRYRVEVVQLGQEESWYPRRFGWSEEAWLKERIDQMLFMIALLPPPRTWRAHYDLQQKEHEAKMAEYEREHQERLRRIAERQTIGCFPSLDDPMDDMD